MAPTRPELRKPIVVLGAPRSGTTLLAEALGAHPDVALAQEPRLVWRYGNDEKSDELRPADARPEVVDHVRTAFAALVAEAGRHRLVEKTPANAVRPGFVDAVLPDALYVHVTRNGWGAVPSMRTFWQRRGQGFDAKQLRKVRRRVLETSPSQWRHYGGELVRRVVSSGGHVALYGPRLAGLQQVADELGHLEASAQQWRACVTRSAAFGRGLPPERYLEVRLEELDGAVLDRVLAFCELAPAPELGERLDREYDPVAANRQAPLDDDEVALLTPYVEPTNRWIGYGAPTAPSVRP